jgi:alpha-tubulin suppressor-like RCC1 family protein
MPVFPANIRFPIRDANGNPTSTVVDMGDMFLRKEQYLTAGLWMWGSNQDEYNNIPAGQLGTNDNLNRSSPTQIGTLATWRQVSCGYRHSAAIKTDGTLWAWGENVRWGEVGISNNTARYSSPVQVGSMTDWKTVACSYGAVFALKTNGTLWAWGRDGYGELGQNNTVNYSSPVQVGTMTDWKQLSVGSFHVLAIKTDGTMWAWGEDTYNTGFPGGPSGRLGLNYPWFAKSAYSSPVQVGSLTDWKQTAGSARSSAAIKNDGTLWTWGSNGDGQLGLNAPITVDYSSPVQVGSLTNWRSVSGGRHHFAAITKEGRLYMWGRNTDGDLGLGNTASYSSPVIVGSSTNWKQVSCGYGWTAALKTDGTLWVWGRNQEAQLGLGNIVNYSSPVQVGTLTSWKSTVNGGCGYYHTGAIQSPDLP